MGLKKGMTNNPKGRPIGSVSPLSEKHRARLADLLETNFERFNEELQKLEGLPFVRAFLDMTKYVVPVPRSEEEKDESKDASKLIDMILEESKKRKSKR